jgi:hypothetical protein
MPRGGIKRDENSAGLANVPYRQWNPSNWAGDEVVQMLVP